MAPPMHDHGPDLTVVMPAHNEAENIRDAVVEWTGTLDRLGIDYELAVYDDGSSDGTGDVLRELARAHPRLRVVQHANIGHGPTILRGYREARGEWVFQVDSDRELEASGFDQFWRRRQEFDVLLGRRAGRSSPVGRRLVTWMARVIVGILFGAGVRDVNTPYRLMRRTALERLLPGIPPTAFAPNVIVAGLAAQAQLRIAEFPVRHRARSAGATSLSAGRALRLGWRCFRETLAARRGRP